MVRFKETKRRSFRKAVSLRILIVIADVFIVYGLTHRYDITFSVILFTNVVGGVKTNIEKLM